MTSLKAKSIRANLIREIRLGELDGQTIITYQEDKFPDTWVSTSAPLVITKVGERRVLDPMLATTEQVMQVNNWIHL